MAILSRRLPECIVRLIWEFVSGVPTDNKKQVIDQMKSLQNKRSISYWRYDYQTFIRLKHIADEEGEYNVQHYDSIRYDQKSYTRYDCGNEWNTHPNDFPRNQLLLYKRYSRQLERRIKELEQQLQKIQPINRSNH